MRHELLVALDLRIQRLMQPQRDVGVLRRVLGRALDAHLLEADLRSRPCRVTSS